MSELQNDIENQEVKQVEEIENHEEVDSELATDSEAEHEEQPQKPEVDAKQEAINKAINKKHFEAQQAKRELAEAQAKLREFEEMQRKAQAAQYENIPPVPDPFDDDYEKKLAEREHALLAQARFKAQQETYLEQQQRLKQEQEFREAQEFNTQVQNYGNRAKELGIEQGELKSAADVVATLGLSNDLVKFIIADKDGPLIVKYLAANQLDGIELAQANPYQAGAKLTEIKSKALNLRPKASKAPPPPTDIVGKVAKDIGNHPLIKGAKFE